MKDLLAYDCEVFKYDNLVVLKRLDGSVYGKWWNNDPDRPENLLKAVREFRLVGYNNHAYDDLIITLMMDPSSTEEDIKALNDKIINKQQVTMKPHSLIDSLDAMQQIDVGKPSLKQIEGNLGMSIEESSVPFDIDQPLTDEQKAETEHYCEHDVDAAIRVYRLREKEYFEVKESLIAMLPEDQRVKAARWNTTTISANMLGAENTTRWSELKGLDALWRKNPYIPEEAWAMWEKLTLNNIMDKGDSVTVQVFGCEVTFGVGGLHGAPRNPETFENVIDADVASMYPSIIVLPWINALGKATQQFDAMRKERVACKKTDPVKAKALKLVLNSVYGNFKNKYSGLNNPFAGATVCIYGQIAAIDLAGTLYEAGYRITNINTDGIMFLANDEAKRPYDEIFREWESKYGLGLQAEHFDRFIQRDVNNYIAVEKGVIKAKGGDCNRYAAPLPFKTDDARIIQICLVDYMVYGTPVEQTIAKNFMHPEMFQYVLKAGPSYRCVKDTDGNIMNKVNRVFACVEGYAGATMLKKWKADGTSSKFADAPDRMFVWNGQLNDDFLNQVFGGMIDIDHYANVAKKKIAAWVREKKKPQKKEPKQDTSEQMTIDTEPEPVKPVVVQPVDILEKVAKKFRSAKRSGAGWIAYCPVHEAEGHHKTMSLHIQKNKKGKGVKLWCVSQHCREQLIMEAMGLTYDDLGRCKTIRHSWQEAFCKETEKYTDGKAVTIKEVYNYTDANGDYLWTKVRYYIDGNDRKQMKFIRITHDPDEPYLEGKGKLHPDPVLYNMPEVLKAIGRGIPVYYVEGEKDVETLRKHGWTATTAGGTGDWNKTFARYFKGAMLTVMADNDDPGMKLAQQVRKDVEKYAFAVRIFVPSDEPKGDITDYLEHQGDIDAVKNRLSTEQYAYAPWVHREMKKNGDWAVDINEGILAGAVLDNEHFVMVKESGNSRSDLYQYNGICYAESSDNVQHMITGYIPKFCRKNAKVKAVAGLVNADCRKVSMNAIESECDYIIVNNGVIDLTSMDENGHYRLLPHDPKYMLKYRVDADYDPEAECPVFRAYLDDLCRGTDGQVDREKQQTIEEYAGLVISNYRVMKCKKSLWLYSPEGNSGKSQLIKVMEHLLDNRKNVCNVDVSTMNRGQNKFSMAAIVGKRMIQIPDFSTMSISESTVFKQLIGGDSVTVEAKGRDEFTYEFKGGLIAGANGLPTFKDDKGNHIAERMIIIPCDHHIEEKDMDPDILEKMLKEKSGILNVLLDGLTRYIQNGHLTIGEASRRAMEDYKVNADTVYRYLMEAYEITHDDSDRVKCAEFNDGYQAWYKENYDEREYSYAVANRNIPDRLAGHGICKKLARIGNTAPTNVYTGLKKR